MSRASKAKPCTLCSTSECHLKEGNKLWLRGADSLALGTGPPADRTCNIAWEAQILPSSSRFGWESHAVVDRLLSVLRLAQVPLHHAEKASRAQCSAADRSTKHHNSWVFEGLSTVWFTAEFFFQVVSCAREMQLKIFKIHITGNFGCILAFEKGMQWLIKSCESAVQERNGALPVASSTVRRAL